MRWKNRERSQNVDDRRGSSVKRVGGGLGIGAILMAVFALIMGENPLQVIQNLMSEGGGNTQTVQTQTTPEEDALAELVSVVLKDTEDVWNKLFQEQLGNDYREPKLVIYSGSVESACGFAQSATGPFYCPADQSVYIDLSFYEDMKTKLNASGEFALAYVIAHEVGHHVQNLLGIINEVQRQKQSLSQAEANHMNVRLELQADFFAGVWAHHAHKMKNILESGDVEAGLNAAAAVGADRMQMKARGYVVPDSFTHGTSDQRVRWFRKGIQNGNLSEGDTFSAGSL
ncbi:MAG TPA: neutral zinc metallopeptidase [Saprospiraceae bacterium]|nr:flagellar biosynthesis protein FlgM [Saprospirales bacterium]HRQ28767.1 neutral zinc metallopeptidase [Saprospiraceae bacterium]